MIHKYAQVIICAEEIENGYLTTSAIWEHLVAECGLPASQVDSPFIEKTTEWNNATRKWTCRIRYYEADLKPLFDKTNP